MGSAAAMVAKVHPGADKEPAVALNGHHAAALSSRSGA